MDISDLESQAISGNSQAQYELGNVYFFDWLAKIYGVKQDNRAAEEWYEKAANQGHAGGQCQLAYLYMQTGVAEKWHLAGDLLAKSALQGDVTAMENLGRAFGSGKGVPYMPDVAEGWLIEAAEKGTAKEQYTIGFFYYYGGIGLKQDYTKAAYWYERAAQRDHLEAIESLAEMYIKGIGVPEDNAKADELLLQAAILKKEEL